VRKLVLEKDTALAREEGRREGLREGMEWGKELGYVQGRAMGFVRLAPHRRRNLPLPRLFDLPPYGCSALQRTTQLSIPHQMWIPEAGSDSVIRLPPPHDMARLPPSPHSRRRHPSHLYPLLSQKRSLF
jgi:hypothetical protein